MKTILSALIVSAAFMGSAYAQEATQPFPESTTSVSRAQVQQELAQAKAQGLLFNGQDEDSNAFYAESSQVNGANLRPAVAKSWPGAREQFQTSANDTRPVSLPR